MEMGINKKNNTAERLLNNNSTMCAYAVCLCVCVCVTTLSHSFIHSVEVIKFGFKV